MHRPNDLVKQRFEREAVILEELGWLTTQISSPYASSPYAYFAIAGKFYLVQEYVEGETIAQKAIAQGAVASIDPRSFTGSGFGWVGRSSFGDEMLLF